LQQGQTDFVETFIPNKKYYYTFRTEDYHGFVSNPTVIYEVEIVEDSGAVYPVIKVVDMSPKQQKTKTKLARKYLHVVPTFKQSMLTVDNKALTSANSANPLFGNVFGTENHPQRFKIRVTSKSSGKKFDLNVGFIHKHEGNIAEQEKWVFEKEMEGIVDKSLAKQEKATKEIIENVLTSPPSFAQALAVIKYAEEAIEGPGGQKVKFFYNLQGEELGYMDVDTGKKYYNYKPTCPSGMYPALADGYPIGGAMWTCEPKVMNIS
jgi:hypothetical protein